ncbi:MAG: branched-chain amino acid ABC transporter permease [Firmicutes bacterium]|nr:branched-chain amino acid ABC transporter permease [Bacillota bacterium]
MDERRYPVVKLFKPLNVVVVLLVLLLAMPLLTKNSYLLGVLILANIYAVYAAGWDLLSGYTGRENFGYALFIGAGAYAVGFISKVFPVQAWLSLPVGGLTAAAFGLLIGIPCLRLKGPYLALATLAAAAIAERVVMIFSGVTGGEEGMIGIAPLSFEPLNSYYYSVIFMAVSIGILYLIGHLPEGLLLKSIKQDETAAEAAGINTTFHKVLAFVVSAFFGGAAGAFNAHYMGYVGPDAVLNSTISLTVIIMAVVGGTGSILGAAGGAYLLTLLGEFLKRFGDFHLLFYTALLVLVVLFMPKGMINSLALKLPGPGSEPVSRPVSGPGGHSGQVGPGRAGGRQ